MLKRYKWYGEVREILYCLLCLSDFPCHSWTSGLLLYDMEIVLNLHGPAVVFKANGKPLYFRFLCTVLCRFPALFHLTNHPLPSPWSVEYPPSNSTPQSRAAVLHHRGEGKRGTSQAQSAGKKCAKNRHSSEKCKTPTCPGQRCTKAGISQPVSKKQPDVGRILRAGNCGLSKNKNQLPKWGKNRAGGGDAKP